MITDKAQFKVGKMTVDVNYHAEVKPCKKIKFTIDGKEEIVSHDDLYSMMVLFGNEAEQDKLIPTKKREMVLIERLLHVKAKKDVKAGEMITVPYTYSIDRETYDEMVKENPRSFREVKVL